MADIKKKSAPLLAMETESSQASTAAACPKSTTPAVLLAQDARLVCRCDFAVHGKLARLWAFPSKSDAGLFREPRRLIRGHFWTADWPNECGRYKTVEASGNH